MDDYMITPQFVRVKQRPRNGRNVTGTLEQTCHARAERGV
jgi:hypothetical protein